MQRVGWTLHIKPGTEAEYVRRHDEIWPEMLEDMRKAGIHNYTIFMQGTTLFNYLECEDWQAVLNYVAKSEINQRWGQFMSDVMDLGEGGRLPPPWKEVFHLD
jgi:L-rhamnose mutarotase